LDYSAGVADFGNFKHEKNEDYGRNPGSGNNEQVLNVPCLMDAVVNQRPLD
jgi:nucleoid DNA-binding protein